MPVKTGWGTPATGTLGEMRKLKAVKRQKKSRKQVNKLISNDIQLFSNKDLIQITLSFGFTFHKLKKKITQ